MSSDDKVTTDGVGGVRPRRQATTGVHVPPGGGGPRRDEPAPCSSHGPPIVNQPVWQAPDIPGSFFLGGLAGAGALVGAAAQATRRPALARVSKAGAALAGHLSLVGLVHDLGRRGRFVNMLRVLKVTSPMSVGSWLLAGFVPASSVAAACDLLGVLPGVGTLATAGAALLGAPVATSTATVVSGTAVPAWHDGHRLMPFVFVTSACSSAAGLGLVGAPTAEIGPVRPLAAAAGLAEVVLSRTMEMRMGMVGEAYHEGKAGHYMKAAEALTVGGALLAAMCGRSRRRAAVAGAALLAGSCLIRFGVFEAGMASAQNPEHTLVPQRERLARRAGVVAADGQVTPQA